MRARHQSLHHFIAKPEWSDDEMRRRVRQTSAISVPPPDVEPLPPNSYRDRGRPAVQPRRTAKRQPLSVKALAQALPESAYQTVRWR